NRVTLGRILLVIGWRVDEAAAYGVGALGEVHILPQLAVRHVLELIKLLVLGGHFNRAAPATSAVEEMSARVRNVRAVDIDGVVVEALIQRPGRDKPRAVLTLGDGRLSA